MANFKLFAHPWWVALLLFVPLLAYVLFRRKLLQLTSRELLVCAVFALSFGFVEGAVAIYLGIALGLSPGCASARSDLGRLSADLHGQQTEQLTEQLGRLPPGLLKVEVIREAATILMLLSVAILAEREWRERFAIFLWTFALWDLGYYITLAATVRWPDSLTSPDVLFFIPVPWTAPVWFPILVSSLTVVVVLLTRNQKSHDRTFKD